MSKITKKKIIVQSFSLKQHRQPRKKCYKINAFFKRFFIILSLHALPKFTYFHYKYIPQCQTINKVKYRKGQTLVSKAILPFQEESHILMTRCITIGPRQNILPSMTCPGVDPSGNSVPTAEPVIRKFLCWISDSCSTVKYIIQASYNKHRNIVQIRQI